MFSFGNIEPSFYADQEVVKCTLAGPDEINSPPIMGQMDPNLTVRVGGYGTKASLEPQFASIDAINSSYEIKKKNTFDSVELIKTIKTNQIQSEENNSLQSSVFTFD